MAIGGSAFKFAASAFIGCVVIAINARCAASSRYTEEAQLDAITSLPGWGDVDFGLFGGYITVDKDAGRALYYILAEHPDNPSEAPLALWLNGGPGCSSIGGGFMSELGPFYPTPGGQKLKRNELSWHSVANVIFLESPAFVGFSYSNSTDDLYTGDGQTTRDTLAFLINFFERFPQYKGRDFWITGESYAGHYIPLLAEAIVDYNQHEKTRKEERINLKGFLLGNPWTDAVVDNIGQVDFLVNHFQMSKYSGQKVLEYCDIYTMWPLPHNKLPNTTQVSNDADASRKAQIEERLRKSSIGPIKHHPDAQLCHYWMKTAFEEIGAVDVYDIYEDLCPNTRATHEVDRLSEVLSPLSAGQALGLARQAMGWSWKANAKGQASQEANKQTKESTQLSRRLLSSGKKGNRVSEDPKYLDPCIQQETEVYLNTPEVQDAIHATPAAGKWRFCSPNLHYSLRDSVDSMIPVYERLLAKAKLNMVVYSGTVDAAVPTTGTQRWIEELDLPIKTGFRAWIDPDRQVGGHVVEYEGLTFVMVRNAGHMVPYTQPVRALHMVSTFFNGKTL